MANKRDVLPGISVAALCVAAGLFCTNALVIASSQKPFTGQLLTFMAAAAIGAGVCAVSAYIVPRLWILWPALFGGQIAVLGILRLFDGGPYAAFDAAAWLAFVAIPALGARRLRGTRQGPGQFVSRKSECRRSDSS
jgi:hypothetical protein